MSSRRQELLVKTLRYAADHSLADLSLRPLAAAIGSSPRVLLYLFGSKEGLLREVSAAERAQEMAILHEAAGAGTAREALQRLWEVVSDPSRRNLSRLFFENYVRSLDDARQTVDVWLEPLGELVGGPERASTVLAVMRGLALDLLATGDRERVDAAWAGFLDGWL